MENSIGGKIQIVKEVSSALYSFTGSENRERCVKAGGRNAENHAYQSWQEAGKSLKSKPRHGARTQRSEAVKAVRQWTTKRRKSNAGGSPGPDPVDRIIGLDPYLTAVDRETSLRRSVPGRLAPHPRPVCKLEISTYICVLQRCRL